MSCCTRLVVLADKVAALPRACLHNPSDGRDLIAVAHEDDEFRVIDESRWRREGISRVPKDYPRPKSGQIDRLIVDLG